MKALFKEPLTWFILAGALIFFLDYQVFADRDENDTIVVSPELIQGIARQEAAVRGHPLDEEEIDLLIRRYVDEEVLVREAYRRGIDQNDGRIRKILLEKMHFLLGENPELPEEGELESWYRERAHYFGLPERRTLRHVYFEISPGNEKDILDELRAQADPVSLGDPFWLGSRLERYTKPDLEAVLGEDFAEYVFTAAPGEWAGPVPSSRGIHLVRVETVTPGRIPEFEEVRVLVEQQWIADRKRAFLEDRIRAMREEYEIVIEPGMEADRP